MSEGSSAVAKGLLADTSAWAAFFRGGGGPLVDTLKAALVEGRLYTAGPVRQELLAGAKHPKDLREIEALLALCRAAAVGAEDFEAAGRMSYRLRRKGVTTHAVDALIAAVALRHDLALLTADADFEPLARHEGLLLAGPTAG